MNRIAILTLAVLGMLALPCFAQAPSDTPLTIVRAADAGPALTVSVEPLFLLAGIAEANIELRVAPHVALQALGGYGGFVFDRIAELGGEANIYLRPQINGPHFGAEIKYLWGSGSIPFADNGTMDDVTEREVGVYAGWKWIGWRGLTAVVQAGVGRLDISGGPPDAGIPKTQIIPAANTTVGMSF